MGLQTMESSLSRQLPTSLVVIQFGRAFLVLLFEACLSRPIAFGTFLSVTCLQENMVNGLFELISTGPVPCVFRHDHLADIGDFPGLVPYAPGSSIVSIRD